MHGICEGDKRNYNIGGDDVGLVEESDMRSSAYSVNENDDLVSGFDASAFAGENVYEFFENEDIIITKDLIVRINSNKKFGE